MRHCISISQSDAHGAKAPACAQRDAVTIIAAKRVNATACEAKEILKRVDDVPVSIDKDDASLRIQTDHEPPKANIERSAQTGR